MSTPMLARGQVNTILSAATGTGRGTVYQVPQKNPGYGGYTTSFACQVNPVGTFSALSVNLEGSLDGVNWFQLSNTQEVSSSLVTQANPPTPVAFMSANVLTFAGGTNVTVLLTLGDV
jgi:hypothetical protein